MIHAEDSAGLARGGEPGLAAELRRAGGDYVAAARDFERRGRDLPAAFRSLERVELWTSAATHALLPLLATDAGRRLQLATGIASHQRRFGEWGGGFWLPECAYEPGLERDLADHGVRAFCVDQSAVPGFDHLRPVATDAGPLAVPIDWEHGRARLARARRLSRRRRVPRLPPAHRPRPQALGQLQAGRTTVTPRWRGRATTRATSSPARRRAWPTEAFSAAPSTPSCSATGGTRARTGWRRSWRRRRGPACELVTVSEGLERVEPQRAPLTASTWGSGKDISTWDSPRVRELAVAARRAELRTVAAAARATEPRAALERAARELLAMQSSDWAFMVTRELAGDYPLRRMEHHGRELEAALASLGGNGDGPAPEPGLRGLAPDLDLAALTTP